MSTILEDQLSKPGTPILNQQALNTTLDLHIEFYAEVGPERYQAARRHVLKTSKFRPDIAEMRAAAGLTAENPIDAEARSALRRIFDAIRAHADALVRLNAANKEELHVSVALKLKALRGEILYDHRSGPGDDSRYVDPPVRGPGVPAPVFSQVTEAALVEVGYGDRAEGLASLAEHPTLAKLWPKGQEPPTLGFREKNARDIEHRWLEAYRRCRAEHLAGK